MKTSITSAAIVAAAAFASNVVAAPLPSSEKATENQLNRPSVSFRDPATPKWDPSMGNKSHDSPVVLGKEVQYPPGIVGREPPHQPAETETAQMT
ncbi:hypothetical protein BLS_002559 [Venturia inaequalis]|nr:hypothetical protein BLS_002559 [Venturia inaequalis]